MWLDQDDPTLGPSARKYADEALRAEQLAVSAISFWEVATLARKGRIIVGLPLAQWRRELLGSGLIEISMDGEIGIAAAGLNDFHGDPADRVIVATTRLGGARLVTADQKVLAWPGRLNCIDARV